MENLLVDNIDVLPLWIQKFERIVKLVLNIIFISGSKHLSISDYIFRNETHSDKNGMNQNDRMFSSRQEMFSLIYV